MASGTSLQSASRMRPARFGTWQVVTDIYATSSLVRTIGSPAYYLGGGVRRQLHRRCCEHLNGAPLMKRLLGIALVLIASVGLTLTLLATPNAPQSRPTDVNALRQTTAVATPPGIPDAGPAALPGPHASLDAEVFRFGQLRNFEHTTTKTREDHDVACPDGKPCGP